MREQRSNASSRTLVVEELLRGSALSQSDLVRRTGLARTTVSNVVEGLLRDEVAERVSGTSLRGRPPSLIGLVDPRGNVAGVDVGHTHVSVAIAASGVIIDEQTTRFAADNSGEAALATAVAALQELMGRTGIDRVGAVSIGVPGPLGRGSDGIARAGGVMAGWKGLDPVARFRALFDSDALVALDNDAHLAAIAEREHGALRGVNDALFLSVGSGVGSGVLIDGLVHRGAHGIAGEIGHVRVVEQGEMCRCGGRGCLETVASVDVAVRALRAVHGDLTAADIPRLLVRRDQSAFRLLDDMGEAIGRALAPVVSVLDPEVVAIGLPWTIDSPLIGAAQRSIARSTQPFVARRVRIRAGEVGARAALLGAIARASRLMKAAAAN